VVGATSSGGFSCCRRPVEIRRHLLLLLLQRLHFSIDHRPAHSRQLR